MKFEFDAKKSERNAIERNLPFSEAENFDYDTSLLVEDARRDYGERRLIAYGYIGKRLHVLCFKPLSQTRIRIISLRKANKREEKFYEENT